VVPFELRGFFISIFMGYVSFFRYSQGIYKKILTGDFILRFYVCVLAMGIILPLAITVFIWRNDVGNILGILLLARFIFVLIGDLTMRHIIMEKAVYSPII
jgi:hypothetical protein